MAFLYQVCKLRHIVQFHRNDTHSYTKEDEDEVPESCAFRRITNNFCILSIQQLWSMHKISVIMYEQLVTYVKYIVQNKGCSKYTIIIERNITDDAKHNKRDGRDQIELKHLKIN